MQRAATVARNGGFAIGRDPASSRLILATDGGDAGTGLDLPGASGPAGAPRTADMPVQQGFRKSFAQLGLPTEIFSGRHYAATLDIDLPPDFLASNDRAQLLLDGGHGATLADGSGLAFRVNGTLVSSLPMASGRAEHFQHAIVELPLRFFHPGHNDIAIEGMTPATADAQCDTLTMTREPRLTIAGSSELDFPGFAHLLTVPQIPAAMAAAARGSDNTTHLYLADHDPATLSAGLTALANLAASQERMGTPRIHFGGFGDDDPPGIVVAAMPDLPAMIGAPLADLAMPAAVADPAPAGDPAASAAPPETDAATPDAMPGTDASDPTHLPEWITGQTASLAGSAEQVLRDHGFFFEKEAKDDALPVRPDGLVVAAIEPGLVPATRLGIALPQVLRDPAHWLVVTAADKGTIETDLRRLVASGRWSALAGQAASFDPKSGTLRLLQPRTVGYVLPDRLVPSDLRPILGGVMSANIPLSIAMLLTLMFILGTSTYLAIRRAGVR